MKKSEYFKFLKSQIGSEPIEKQTNQLSQIVKWNEEYQEKIKKGMKRCPECGKYSKEKDYKTCLEKGTVIESTYTDCGYGDDDKIGEVEYLFEIFTCPKCLKQTKEKKHFVRILWEKNRK